MNYLCHLMGLLPVSLAMRQFFSGGIQSQQARLYSACGAVAILGTGVKRGKDWICKKGTNFPF